MRRFAIGATVLLLAGLSSGCSQRIVGIDERPTRRTYSNTYPDARAVGTRPPPTQVRTPPRGRTNTVAARPIRAQPSPATRAVNPPAAKNGHAAPAAGKPAPDSPVASAARTSTAASGRNGVGAAGARNGVTPTGRNAAAADRATPSKQTSSRKGEIPKFKHVALKTDGSFTAEMVKGRKTKAVDGSYSYHPDAELLVLYFNSQAFQYRAHTGCACGSLTLEDEHGRKRGSASLESELPPIRVTVESAEGQP